MLARVCELDFFADSFNEFANSSPVPRVCKLVDEFANSFCSLPVVRQFANSSNEFANSTCLFANETKYAEFANTVVFFANETNEFADSS